MEIGLSPRWGTLAKNGAYGATANRAEVPPYRAGRRAPSCVAKDGESLGPRRAGCPISVPWVVTDATPMPRSKRWWKPCPSHPPASQPPGLPRHTETSAPWQLSSQGQPSSDGPLVTATERMLLLACGPTWTRYTSLVGQRRSAWRTLASKGDPRRAAPTREPGRRRR